MSKGERLEHQRAMGVTQAESSARHSVSTERLRAAFDGMAVGMILKGAEGETLESNPALQRMLGYGEKELRGMVRSDYTHPEDAGRDAELYRQLLAGERDSFRMEKRYVRKDGSVMWGRLSVSRIEGVESEPAFAVGVVEDITENREAKQEIERLNRQNRLILDSAGEGIYGLDREGNTTFVNPAAAALTGFDPAELIGKDQHEVIHHSRSDGTPYPREECPIHAAIRDGGVHRVDNEVFWSKDGTAFPVAYTSTPILEDDEVVGTVVTFTDVTERKKAKEVLKESEGRLRTIVGNVPVVLFALDREGVFTLSEGKGLEALGLESSEVVGRSVFEVYRDAPEIAQHVRRSLDGEEVSATVGVGEATFEMFYSPLVDEGGGVVGVSGVASDITERVQAEERLEYQVLHDLLTDLPNRLLFVNRLGQALERTRRRKSHKVAVLFVDLDGFKVVNDSLGHETGDRLLVVVAERLQWCLRPEDTLARFGGDEFTVLIEDVESPEDAVRVADRILECLGEPFVVDGTEIFVGASIGIAMGSASTKSSEEMLRDADTAMYRAKEAGSQYRMFDPQMYERAVERLELENNIRRAIRTEEFVVHYQPIVHLQSGEVRKVEALVRWKHPERGLLDPSQFLPVAEESGLVVPLGEGVLEEACRQVKRWKDEHPRVPPLAVSVNLSARQLRDPRLVKTVEDILRRTGFEAHCLSLEITETVYIKVLEGNTAALDKLTRQGVCISIDDFGVGYSSLAYLKRLPADAVKIDKSFVAGIGEDVEDTAIVGMVIDLAHTLGMEAVAEGVESEEQATLLREMGCDHAQGFHFSKALPPEAASRFLVSR